VNVESTRFIQSIESTPEEFTSVYGVTREVYKRMAMTHQALSKRKRDGRGCTLSAAEQVLCSLQYWSNPISHAQLAAEWGIHRATVIRLIEKVKASLHQFAELRPLHKKQGKRVSKTKEESQSMSPANHEKDLASLEHL
jgi:predicted DNA-binding protein YlxM (UPF0122 family)